MAQLPTHPPSPRVARRQLRDSNDANGFISIEDYLYRIDPYRSTTISDPLPYPLDFRTAYPPQRSRILSHREEIEATCSWDGEDSNRFDEGGRLVRASKGVTRENIILNRKTANGRTIQGDFGVQGDSGSLLVNKDGKICGLFYGRATSWIGPNGDEQRVPSAGLAMTVPELVRGINRRMTVYNELGLPVNAPVTMSLPTEVSSG